MFKTPASSAAPATPHRGLSRRHLLAALPLAGAALVAPRLLRAATGTPIEVWKDPSCGCCHDWIAHMQANGFSFTIHDTGNNAVRTRLGLPQKLGSCHTALVGGYLIEGHVSASDVRALLQQKPKALGLRTCSRSHSARHARRLARHGWRGVRQPPRPLRCAAGGARWQHPRLQELQPKGLVMKPLARSVVTLLLASALGPVLAQAPAPADDHDSHHPAAAPTAPAAQGNPGNAPADQSDLSDLNDLSNGEITRWDPRTLKVTIRHGEIKNLGMPPMTMVFRVNDASMLAPFQPGDKVLFRVEQQSGGYFITRMEAAR